MKKIIIITIRAIVTVMLFVACIWFMLPLDRGILHIGMLYPVVIFVAIAVIINIPDKLKAFFKSKYRWLARTLASLFAAGLAAVIIPLAAMAAAAADTPAESSTVVVLGCQVRGSTPSLMLHDRCSAALEYLRNNPDAKCIASGGQGANEDISEAQAIFNFLTQNGIDAERIYLEDESFSTYENIGNSAHIIEENGLNTNIAVASDNFHQLRAQLFAERNGLSAASIGCKTKYYLAAGYWTREVLAVYKALLLGR